MPYVRADLFDAECDRRRREEASADDMGKQRDGWRARAERAETELNEAQVKEGEAAAALAKLEEVYESTRVDWECAGITLGADWTHNHDGEWTGANESLDRAAQRVRGERDAARADLAKLTAELMKLPGLVWETGKPSDEVEDALAQVLGLDTPASSIQAVVAIRKLEGEIARLKVCRDQGKRVRAALEVDEYTSIEMVVSSIESLRRDLEAARRERDDLDAIVGRENAAFTDRLRTLTDERDASFRKHETWVKRADEARAEVAEWKAKAEAAAAEAQNVKEAGSEMERWRKQAAYLEAELAKARGGDFMALSADNESLRAELAATQQAQRQAGESAHKLSREVGNLSAENALLRKTSVVALLEGSDRSQDERERIVLALALVLNVKVSTVPQLSWPEEAAPARKTRPLPATPPKRAPR